jgi:DnaJ family protein A protein 2
MTKKLRLTKSVICKDCDGKGGKGISDATCKDCRGQGIRVVIRQLGPGMIQQMQTQCDRCNGEGTVIPDKDRCKTCKGVKTTKEKKTLEVFVSKGMAHNTKIPFKGEADEAPNTIPGDVIVVLQQKEHEVFKRDGPNLFMKKKLTLQEALCGFKFIVVHLDNRHLIVKSEDSTIITPGAYKAIKDEGMPSVKNPYVRGSLYIEFDIEFPKAEQLTKEIKQNLIKLLPSPSPQQLPTYEQPMDTDGNPTAPPEQKEAEEVTLTDVDITQEKRKFEEQHKEAYEEDEDRGGRGQGQPCRAQ